MQIYMYIYVLCCIVYYLQIHFIFEVLFIIYNLKYIILDHIVKNVFILSLLMTDIVRQPVFYLFTNIIFWRRSRDVPECAYDDTLAQ